MMLVHRPLRWRALLTLLSFLAVVMISLPTTGRASAAGQASYHSHAATAHPRVSGPQQGDILYQADWSKGMDGWAGSSDWKVLADKGLLLNDGTNVQLGGGIPAGPTIVAPYDVKPANYAVEARIQMLSYTTCTCYDTAFGLSVRATSSSYGWKGYMAGIDLGNGKLFVATEAQRLAEAPLNTDTSWHTYRIEVKDNEIKLLLDGSPLIDILDNHYLSGGQVGLWCYAAQLQVSSFIIYTV